MKDSEYGELGREGERHVLRFARRFAHPREKVWRALTEPEHMAAWFPDEMQGERVAGASLRFVDRSVAAVAFDGEMLVFDPPSVMEMRWGEDVLRFELHEDGEGTRLVFTDTLAELGKAARDGAGWHVCLAALAREIDGAREPASQNDEWRAVHDAYVERLGPDASTIGVPPEFEQAGGTTP